MDLMSRYQLFIYFECHSIYDPVAVWQSLSLDISFLSSRKTPEIPLAILISMSLQRFIQLLVLEADLE